MVSSFESDEAFARRLQDQEMGTHAAADPQTPLMVIMLNYKSNFCINVYINYFLNVKLGCL